MLFSLFALSVCQEAEENTNPLFKLLEGEWNIFDKSKVNATEPEFTAEIHLDALSKKLVGSVWRNTFGNQENRIHKMDEAQLAQFGIVSSGISKGKVIDFLHPGEIITSFEFKPMPEGAIVASGKLDLKHQFTIKFYNNSDVTLMVSEKGKAEIMTYDVKKPAAIEKSGFFGKFQIVAYVLVGVFFFQLILLCCCTVSKNKLEEQLEIAQGRKLKSVKDKYD